MISCVVKKLPTAKARARWKAPKGEGTKGQKAQRKGREAVGGGGE